ncbi:Imm26 family immunity protein [Hymenobacter defluvii]|uniref:Uncharacterized protein n=1 Tax=Hymenobacter defluvii TaxID=2054411 RepID=A0ABS3TAM3_9BACT|nr:Imm26 family immunity protein [Hymenobacter defluvii]MBO3270710.1 hypothetical protein [Hymenobacter defluvii]
MITYPFLPKSNRQLQPGQFWAIPLTNGFFACGRVLDVPPASTKNYREFYAGLLDWTDSQPPCFETIVGAQILKHGFMHVKGLIKLGQPIIGCRPLQLDAMVVPLTVESQSWRPNARVFQGYVPIRNSQREEHPLKITIDSSTDQFQTNPTTLPAQAVWGYNVIRVLAEQYFGDAV